MVSVAPVHSMQQQQMSLPYQVAVSLPMSLGAPLNVGSPFSFGSAFGASPMMAAAAGPMMMSRPAMLPAMGQHQMMMASPAMMAMRPHAQFANQGKPPWSY
jgi:hypothetical protein